jgi:hypothetical protein
MQATASTAAAATTMESPAVVVADATIEGSQNATTEGEHMMHNEQVAAR